MVGLTGRRYVSKEKLVYAKEISDVDEHIIYAAFSARAVKFAREDGFGHGKNCLSMVRQCLTIGVSSPLHTANNIPILYALTPEEAAN